jgi:hypothetical protein
MPQGIVTGYLNTGDASTFGESVKQAVSLIGDAHVKAALAGALFHECFLLSLLPSTHTSVAVMGRIQALKLVLEESPVLSFLSPQERR